MVYKNKSKSRNPGKGRHMEAEALKQIILYSFEHRSCEIERNLKVSHGVAVRVYAKVKKLGLSKDKVEELTPDELSTLWYKRRAYVNFQGKKLEYMEPDFDAMQAEYIASKKHNGSRTAIKVEQTHRNIVRDIYLSEENTKEAKTAGKQLYSESHVLRMWREKEKTISPVFRKASPMGYAAELDFTGIVVPYTVNGEQRNATLMVMVLPASRMTLVYAIESQRNEHVCPAIAEAFKEYGALPQVLVVDNFKGAVSTADIYGGEINPKMQALGHYFGLEIQPCRPLSPKDKGTVERTVRIINKLAGARLASEIRKGREFHSLDEIQAYIKPLVEQLNNSRVRGFSQTRRELFEQEKKFMRKVTCWDYQYPENLIEQKVPDTAIFEYCGHQYALPAKWCGQMVEVEVLTDTIKFYSNGSFITMYRRLDGKTGLSTKENYTPINHMVTNSYELEGVESLFRYWADNIGPDVKRLITRVQGCRSSRLVKNHICYGILNLPEANKADYEAYNNCVLKCLNTHSSLPSHSVIRREWNKTEHSNSIELDRVFNSKNYLQICFSYMYGRTERLEWNE